MTYQYLNSNYNLNNQNKILQQPIKYSTVNGVAIQNPFDTSFYNQNNIFPFNPLYLPKINQNYSLIGQISSPSGEIVNLYKLSNGHNVAIMPRKNQATIVKTFLDGGSMNETDNVRGISHCIEHCLFKGSSKLKDGDVFRLTSLMGANTNASTDYAKTDYYITAPYMNENNLEKTIEIQGDMISNPLFNKAALESEKGPICSEISMINDDPMTIAFDTVIRNLFQIKSESHNLVAGSIGTVSNLTRDNLVNHHSTYYNPNNLYTVVVGDVDVDKTIDLISKNFTLPAQKPDYENSRTETLTPIEQSKRVDIRTPKATYTSVVMGFSGPKPQDSKDFIIGKMINYYLSTCSSSVLKKNLEEINADYASDNQKVGLKQSDPYAIVCVLGLNPGDEQKGIDIFYDAVQKLQNEFLSDDDMAALYNYINKDLELLMCDSENICDMLGGCYLDNSIDLFANYRGLIQSITKQDIMNYARKYFDLSKVSMVVVHPESVSEKQIKSNYDKSKYSLQNIKKNRASGLISFCGEKKISSQDVEELILANNTHLALNNTNSNLCVFNWTVKMPPIKPKNPNIPAVLRYMFLKGTDFKNQSELEKFKELNGINASVYVNGKSIEINADCLVNSVDKTLSVINELMFHPNLTQQDFIKAKDYVKDMLKNSEKDAASNLLDGMLPDFFPNSAKMLKTIDDLTLDDVKEFYQELLKNASSTFVATAPFVRYPDIREQIINNQSLSNIVFKDSTPKLAPLFKETPETVVICDSDELNQAQIYKSYRFPLSGNIFDEAKFEILNTILGGSPNSRLFLDLREKQNLAYSVSSAIQSFENSGILTLKIQTTTHHKDQGVTSYDNVKKSLDGFKRHTDDLCNDYVTDEELEAAKMKLKQNVIGLTQNPYSDNDLLALNIAEPYGIKRIDKYIDAINNVTKEDIKQAANFIFSRKPTISILASQDTINSQLNYLKQLGRIQQS